MADKLSIYASDVLKAIIDEFLQKNICQFRIIIVLLQRNTY